MEAAERFLQQLQGYVVRHNINSRDKIKFIGMNFLNKIMALKKIESNNSFKKNQNYNLS